MVGAPAHILPFDLGEPLRPLAHITDSKCSKARSMKIMEGKARLEIQARSIIERQQEKRRKRLELSVTKHGLKLRSDSHVCASYIKTKLKRGDTHRARDEILLGSELPLKKRADMKKRMCQLLQRGSP